MRPIEQICSHGVYLPALGPASVVIDAGANRGEFSREIQRRTDCITLLMEANPNLHRNLVAEGFRVHLAALGDRDGTARFNISVNPEGSSLLDLPARSVYGAILDQVITVPLVSLPTFLTQNRLVAIDMLKLDIEGAEVMVINGLSDDDLIRISQITVEFHDEASFQLNRREEVVSIIERLRCLGFTVIRFNRPAHTNVLFLGPNLTLGGAGRRYLRMRYEILPYWRRRLGEIRQNLTRFPS